MPASPKPRRGGMSAQPPQHAAVRIDGVHVINEALAQIEHL